MHSTFSVSKFGVHLVTSIPSNIKMDHKLLLLFFTSVVLSGVHSVKITKTQNEITIKKGEPFELLCAADIKVRACTIQTPYGETMVMWPGAAYENGRITKHGGEEKECGIKVNGAQDTDNGSWECIISAQGPEGSISASGFVGVTVAVPPEKVELKIGENVNPQQYSVKMQNEKSDQLSVDCVAEQARPAPEFVWYLGEEKLNAGKKTEADKSDDGKANYVETLLYYPDSSHNGKKLRCEVNHQAYTEAQKQSKENEVDVLLQISYPPTTTKKDQTFYDLKVGQENPIRIEFGANPKPTAGFWTVGNGTKIPFGTELDIKTKKYRSGPIEPKDGLEGQWSVTLTFLKLNEADIKGTNKLSITNEEGTTEYNFKLALGAQPPPAGSDTGKSLTVGIIVIIVIIVLILVIVIIARAKGMMCFAAAKGGDELDEEKEAFENVEKGESNAIVQDSKPVGDSNSNKGTPDKKLDDTPAVDVKAETEEKKSNGAHTPV